MLLTTLCLIAALMLAGGPAHAQAPDPAWAACRTAPERACVLTEAMRAAEALSQPQSRNDGLVTIVRLLTEAQHFDDALIVSASLRQESNSLVIRAQLVGALANAGRFAEADQVAQAIHNPGWRGVAEAAHATALAAKGAVAASKARFALAIQFAHGAGRSGDFAVRRIATEMIRAGETGEALALVRTIATPQWRLRGLIDVAKAMSATRPSIALELLQEASKVPSLRGDPVWTIYEMRDVALAQAGAGGTKEARATLEHAARVALSFEDQGSRDAFLEVVGIALSKVGLTAEAAALAQSLNNDWPRVRVATAAGAAAAKASRRAEADAAYDLAVRAADGGRAFARPYLHAHIAESEASVRLADRLAISLDRMDKAAVRLEEPHRSRALAMAATTRLRFSSGDVAAVPAAIADAGLRDAELSSLVEKLIEEDRLDTAQAAARSISAPMSRGYPMSLISAAQAKAGKMSEALALLDAIPAGHYRRVYALAAIAAALDQ